MKNKNKFIAVAVLVVLAAATAFFVLGRGSSATDNDGAGRTHEMKKHPNNKKQTNPKTSTSSKRRTDAQKDSKARRKPKISDDDEFSHLTGEDRAIAIAIDKAFDDDDFKGVVAAAARALSSTNTEVRMKAVESLGWFGEKALPELTIWLSDKDGEVAEEAMNQWTSALSEVEKPDDRFSIAASALNTIADPDALETIGFELSSSASELIDDEEDEKKAGEKRTQVVETLADIILNGQPKNQAAAKEAYSDITGNDWISVEEAEKYLRDPDNYEPPDDDNDSDEKSEKPTNKEDDK